MSRQFTEVGSNASNNPRWEPQKNHFDPNNPPFIEGYFKSFREITGGPNGPFMVATIHTLDMNGQLSTEVDISGGAVLDDKLADITIGKYIRIEFGGKQPSKTPGRSYNVWKTFTDDNAITYQQLGGTVRQTAAPMNQPPVQQQPVFNPQQGFQQQVQQPNFPQQQNPFTPPVQNFQPPANQLPASQNFQQPPVQQPFTTTLPNQTTQQPPVQQQPWTPPASNPAVFNTPPANQPPAQQQFQQQQPPPPANPNVFGGQQYTGQSANDDLPF